MERNNVIFVVAIINYKGKRIEHKKYQSYKIF